MEINVLKGYLGIVFFVLITLSGIAQDRSNTMPGKDIETPGELALLPIFTDINAALRQPTKVYRLALKDAKDLPSDLNQFTNLRELDLSNCRISTFPVQLLSLSQLEVLDLSGNYLKELPESLIQLTKLQTLKLSGNPLGKLPSSFTQMGQLNGLSQESTWKDQINLSSVKHDSLGNRLTEAKLWADSLKALAPVSSIYQIQLPQKLKKIDSVSNSFQTFEQHLASSSVSSTALDSLTQGKAGQAMKSINNQLDSLKSWNKLEQGDLSQLPGLPAMVINKNHLSVLDSLRSYRLAAEHLKIKEKQLSDSLKLIVLKEKESIIKRSFVEGIIGVNPQMQSVTFSPAVGVRLVQALSVGLGVNVVLDVKNLSSNTILGFRSFARYDLIPKKFYIQLEDNGYFSRFTPNSGQMEGGTAMKHLAYLGAGYLLPFSRSCSLNLMTLYQLNRDQLSPYVYSPFIFRIGISAFPKNNHIQQMRNPFN